MPPQRGVLWRLGPTARDPQARLYRDVKKVISLLKREDYTAVWIRPEEVARSRLRDREKVRGVCAVYAPFY